MMRIENHVFVIWPWAKKQSKIMRYIEKNFHVLDQGTVGPVHLGKFYGIKSTIAADEAYLYVVRTNADRAHRQTSTGFRQVNPLMFDTKQKLREWGGKDNGLNSVHGTDDPQETQRNLLELAPRYESLREVFDALRSESYVFLRNFHGEPDHSDIDLLVESVADIRQRIRPIKVDAYGKSPDLEAELKYKYLVRIGDELAKFDLRYVGDGYFDEDWQRQVIEFAIYEDYYWRPNDHDWYWTLLYHAHFHKGTLKVYRDQLDQLRPGDKHDRSVLVKYMHSNGFTFPAPDDPVFVHFNLLKGKVADGAGIASTGPQPGLEETWEKGAGYKPYPGTLNVELHGNFQLPKPTYTGSGLLFSKSGDSAKKVPLYFWPAQIDGQEVTLMYGDERFFQPRQVEILAPVNLRKTLKLETGDEVTVVVL